MSVNARNVVQDSFLGDTSLTPAKGKHAELPSESEHDAEVISESEDEQPTRQRKKTKPPQLVEKVPDQLTNELFNCSNRNKAIPKLLPDSSDFDYTTHTAFTHLQKHMRWPVLYANMPIEEAAWILDYLENMWMIPPMQSSFMSIDKRSTSRLHLGNGSAYQSDSDDSFDSFSDSEESDESSEDFVGASKNGPGAFQNYSLLYTVDDMEQLRGDFLAAERFDVRDDDPRTLNAQRLDALMRGMRMYMTALSREFLASINKNSDADYSNFQRVLDGEAAEDAVEAFKRMFPADGVPPDYSKRITRILFLINNARALLRARLLMETLDSTRSPLPLGLEMFGMASLADYEPDPKLKPDIRTEITREYLVRCKENNYRRFQDEVYEEIITSNNHHTLAFRSRCTITDFVYEHPDPIAQPKRWNRLMQDKSAMKEVIQYLTKCTVDGDYFPDLKRSRTQWSFKNGVYCAETDSFYEYGKRYDDDEHAPFGSQIASAKYYDFNFPLDILDKSPDDIKVSSVDMILDAQKLDPDVKRWMWILFGRLFYNLNVYDNWQVTPYIKGVAGTGKSTLVRLFENLYEESCIGTFETNMESMFGLQSMHDKFLVLGAECRADFSLPQASFQKMTSGERMAIPRKNRATKNVQWTAPMLLCGNEFPAWTDTGGAIGRRMIPILFNYTVSEKKTVTDLESKIRAEMALIIVKANRSYRAVINAGLAKRNIWSLMPASISKARQTMRAETSAVALFLKECQKVNDVNKSVKFNDFFSEFKRWVRNSQQFQTRKPDVSRDHVLHELETLPDIRLETVKDDCDNINHYLYGIRLPSETKMLERQNANQPKKNSASSSAQVSGNKFRRPTAPSLVESDDEAETRKRPRTRSATSSAGNTPKRK